MSVQVSDRPTSSQVAAVHAAIHSIDIDPSKSTVAKRLSVVIGQMLAVEFLIVATSTYVSAMLYHYVSYGVMPSLKHYIDAALFIAATFSVLSLCFRHFAMAKRQQLHMFLWSGIGAVALTFAIFLTGIFLLKISHEFSRGAFIFELATVCIVVCVFRTTSLFWLRTAIASGAIESRRVIVIGDTNLHSSVMDELTTGGIRIVKWIPHYCPHNNNSNSDGDRTYALNGSARKMIDLCRSMLPDDVVILAGQKDLSLASDLAHSLSEIPCSIHIAPLDEIRFLARSHIGELDGILTLQVAKPPLSLADLIVKRTLDIVIATMALIALSPLLLCVALAIKIDSKGPVLFRQKRHGYNNKVIQVYKFRSMTVSEDGDLAFASATPNDVRVTALGRILRRTNIDELPQLLNVLFGEMSIVGPRPHATIHNQMFEDVILPFARRHNVKPGITGWAQVNGHRGAADTLDNMRRRVEYDLYYIDNWTFLFDLKIIMMTLLTRKAYTNAY